MGALRVWCFLREKKAREIQINANEDCFRYTFCYSRRCTIVNTPQNHFSHSSFFHVHFSPRQAASSGIKLHFFIPRIMAASRTKTVDWKTKWASMKRVLRSWPTNYAEPNWRLTRWGSCKVCKSLNFGWMTPTCTSVQSVVRTSASREERYLIEFGSRSTISLLG